MFIKYHKGPALEVSESTAEAWLRGRALRYARLAMDAGQVRRRIGGFEAVGEFADALQDAGRVDALKRLLKSTGLEP